MTNDPAKAPKSQKHSSLLELLPLVCFFISYQIYGLMVATAVLMVASTVALSYAYLKLRYVSLPLVVGTGLIVVFGALSLIMRDETFIKMRPTLVNFLFASVLLVGVYGFRRGVLSMMFAPAFSLSPQGWLVLSKRFGYFFLTLGALNELVWRSQSTEFWVNYKVFGVMGLTLLFTMSQIRTMKRYTK